ncbi:histidine phosphatase family protein [Patescibacteria group bacterium]|nr:histidine phosphatase family protein [Patescibacteria group bacterium]
MNTAYINTLIDKIPKDKIRLIYTFDAAAAVSSLKNPGITLSDLPKGKVDKKPFIVVFRHGQSTDNIERIYSGWRDETPLTETGIEQAKALKEKLKNIDIDYYFQSDQVRSMQTLEHALGQKKNFLPISDWRLKERNYGLLNGTSKEQDLKSNPLLATLYRRSWDYVPPLGESTQMVYFRTLSFIKELTFVLKMEQKSAAICCSNNSMRAIRSLFEKLTPSQASTLENPTGMDYCLYNL